jgi:hypothetical protein
MMYEVITDVCIGLGFAALGLIVFHGFNAW